MLVVIETSRMQLIFINAGLINIYSYEKCKFVLKNVYFKSNNSDFILNYGDYRVFT